MSHICPIYIPVRRLRSAVGHRRWTAAPTPSHTVANTCIYMGPIRGIWHTRGIWQVVNSRAFFSPDHFYSAKNKKKKLEKEPGFLSRFFFGSCFLRYKVIRKILKKLCLVWCSLLWHLRDLRDLRVLREHFPLSITLSPAEFRLGLD